MNANRRRTKLYALLDRHWAAWVISGVGLTLAGLSLWYLIVLKALFIGSAPALGLISLVLKAIEVTLLAGFSLVLVYAGYWLASSPLEKRRIWWAGLWTMIGLTGIVAIVALVTAVQIMQGQEISEPTLVQEMLLAAGGGGIAGLLIGISTIRETLNSEQVEQQRDTLIFVNKLLRHNVLNGMQVIQGNTGILEDHVEEEGVEFLETTEERTERIVNLINDVRALVDSVSGDRPLKAIPLRPTIEREVEKAREAHPGATIDVGLLPRTEVLADDLLDSVFENILTNAVEHNDAETPRVEITVEKKDEFVTVRISDNGPGLPQEDREILFEPGIQSVGSSGEGLGLYLVDKLIAGYGGQATFEDNHPQGTVVAIDLRIAD